jgi:preprotein translocase subunit SecG
VTGLILLILALAVLTAIGVLLDHRGLDVGALFGTTDPRELVERGRERGRP